MIPAALGRLARFDLPLAQAPASRLLPWILAALVGLAVVVLGLAAVADRALEAYAGRARLATVSLPSVESARQSEARIAAALDLLNGTPGVTSARPVPAGELEQLVEPWLGQARTGADLPLPRLIDVTLDPAVQLDLAVLQEALRGTVPGATVGLETVARDHGERLAGLVRAWASVGGAMLLLGVLAAAVLITRASLGAQDREVELLRCLGASDAHLARQFERHALLCALAGGIAGFLLAAPTLAALLHSGRVAGLAETIALGLAPADWLLLACVPAISVLLVVAAARMTAMRRLARMP